MAVRAALALPIKEKNTAGKRSLLITGGNGFIGQSLRAAIASSFRILAPSHAEIDLTRGSAPLNLFIGNNDVKCIVHLANPRVYTSNLAMGQTLTMLRNVIDVCLAKDIPLIYPSGWEIYSGYAERLTVDETTQLLPRGPYGETKYLAETLIHHCNRAEGLRCAILRSSPVYGKGGDRPKFIYNFIEKARQSHTIFTHHYRNGNPELDLLYIDDFISAIVKVLESGFIGTLNLGTGFLISTHQVAQIIIKKLNSRSRVEQIAIESDVACIAMNWGRAQKTIGWEPKTQFKEGLDLILMDICSKKGINS